MQAFEAARILKSLVDGRDPASGNELPTETVLHQPQVIRALLIAQNSIDSCLARKKRRALLPERVGIQWTPAEDEKLTLALAASAAAQLGHSHNRWNVMKRVISMCGRNIDDAVAQRVAIEIRALR